MAKFTVYFKEKAQDTEFFDSGVIHIGRDETNDLAVDSLAIAPAHAAVIINESECVIKQLNDNYPLIINNVPTKESVLQNNDRINIGKHSIVFNISESVTPISGLKSIDKDLNSLNEQIGENIKIPEANLQVMDGSHIGRILPLKNTMTRIGNTGSGIAVISRRKDGYFIAALENPDSLIINNEALGEKSIKLINGDIVSIDDTSMQFFC